MVKFRAVVFDMDGLMFNTEDVYCLVGSELSRRRGHVFSDQLRDAMMGRPPQAAFEVMIQHLALSDDWRELAAESDELFIGLLEGRLAPMPGLLDLLDALEAAGIPKAIGTSSSRRLVDVILSRFDLHSRFQFILCSNDIARGKPDPEIYLKAAGQFGIRPAEMLVLEDSQNGCRAAAAAGAYTVAVPGGHSSGQDFSMASTQIDSLADPRLYRLLGLSRQP